MEYNINRVDEANAVVTSIIQKAVIDQYFDKAARTASKSMNVAGFRKGKVPVSVVKQRHEKELLQEAQGEVFRGILTQSLEEIGLTNEDLISEPSIVKFDQKEDGSIDLETKLSFRPNVDLGEYKTLLPEVNEQEVKEEEVTKRLESLAKERAPLEAIKSAREVKDKDFAVIDFEGFVNDVPFEGGKAEKYALEVGSGSFIPGFEDQIIGMKYEEEKDVNVTFPSSYQSKDLAGKEAVFKVKLHEIQEKVPSTIDDEFAQGVLNNEDNVTLDTLKNKIQEDIQQQQRSTYYKEELKPAYLEALAQNLEFALPQSVVDQEINMALNNKVKDYSEEQIKQLQDNPDEVDKLREELKEEAQNSVKVTFIVDALAKAENVDVNDQEISQVIYYEALQTGQNPQELLKLYQDRGVIPAIKLSMLEERVINKLFDEKLGQ